MGFDRNKLIFPCSSVPSVCVVAFLRDSFLEKFDKHFISRDPGCLLVSLFSNLPGASSSVLFMPLSQPSSRSALLFVLDHLPSFEVLDVNGGQKKKTILLP